MTILGEYMAELGLSAEDISLKAYDNGHQITRQAINLYLLRVTKSFRNKNARVIVDILNDKRDELIRRGSNPKSLPPVATVSGVFIDG